ncbi:MAG: OmpH family outer membrane protein [Pyrinomonadaceae bacterium]
MKRGSLFIVSLVFAAVFAVSSFAQNGGAAQPAGPLKIGIINTFAFGDEKAGITKYINALKAINTEFTPTQTELDTMNTRLSNLAKEIQVFRDQATAGRVPIDEKTVQAKVDEAEKLQRDLKFKQEDAKARYEKRQQAVIGPVMQDIGKALQDFAKQKGFTLLLDIAKDEAGLLLAIGDEKIDVTKDFIIFYNARPSATATTATPR